MVVLAEYWLSVGERQVVAAAYTLYSLVRVVSVFSNILCGGGRGLVVANDVCPVATRLAGS